MRLAFTNVQIVSVFTTASRAEKIFKFPFEEAEFLEAGHPDYQDYLMSCTILAKTLWDSLIPHSLMLGRRDEITFEFSGEQLRLRSGDADGYSTTTTCPRQSFYELSRTVAGSFTLIKSELLALVDSARMSSSLVKIAFGLQASPVVIDIVGIEGMALQYIISMMTEGTSTQERPTMELDTSVIAESDGESPRFADDDFAIPPTPDYVY